LTAFRIWLAGKLLGNTTLEHRAAVFGWMPRREVVELQKAAQEKGRQDGFEEAKAGAAEDLFDAICETVGLRRSTHMPIFLWDNGLTGASFYAFKFKGDNEVFWSVGEGWYGSNTHADRGPSGYIAMTPAAIRDKVIELDRLNQSRSFKVAAEPNPRTPA
jgi:hypothetical protein